MDWDEVRLVPAVWLMHFSGMAALLLAVVGAVDGHPLASASAAVGLVLLVAAQRLCPGCRGSIRFASIAAALGLPVWASLLVAMADHDDPSISFLCLAMAGGSAWASRFLHAELQPPDWLRSTKDTFDDEVDAAQGWIEELPADALFVPA